MLSRKALNIVIHNTGASVFRCALLDMQIGHLELHVAAVHNNFYICFFEFVLRAKLVSRGQTLGSGHARLEPNR